MKGNLLEENISNTSKEMKKRIDIRNLEETSLEHQEDHEDLKLSKYLKIYLLSLEILLKVNFESE